MPTSVEKALDEQPVCMVLKKVNVNNVYEFLVIELNKLAMLLNIDNRLNLQAHQMPFLAESLVDMFPNESLADFTLCFKKGVLGKYGDIFRLDGAVIMGWMEKYLEEKYHTLETRLKKEKKEFEDTLPTEADLKAYNERMEKWKESIGHIEKVADNSKENDFHRSKLKYTPLPQEEIEKKQLHLEWIRENFDAITGKPKPDFIPESDWLKNKQQ